MLGIWYYKSAKSLHKAVNDARAVAEQEAAKSHPCYRSRGTFYATADRSKGQCKPQEEANAVIWKRSFKELRALVILIHEKYPDVQSVYICGGFDGADSYQDLWVHDNYEPWVSSWNVEVWTRS